MYISQKDEAMLPPPPPPPPFFGHVCTLNEEKISSFSMSATNVEQLNQNFCLRLHQKLSQSTKTPKNFLGGLPPDPPRL